MWIISGGLISQNIANVLKKSTQKPVQGESLEDIILTVEKRGAGYFNKVKGIVVLDAALDSLKDLTALNTLATLDCPIHFMNRYGKAMNLTMLDSRVQVYNVEDIYIKDIQNIIVRGDFIG